MAKPRKALYRARAHSNPLNDTYFDAPAHPDDLDWWRPPFGQKLAYLLLTHEQ